MATALRVRPPLTYEEYRLLPEDGKRYELMEGDLFVSPAPSPLVCRSCKAIASLGEPFYN